MKKKLTRIEFIKFYLNNINKLNRCSFCKYYTLNYLNNDDKEESILHTITFNKCIQCVNNHGNRKYIEENNNKFVILDNFKPLYDWEEYNSGNRITNKGD